MQKYILSLSLLPLALIISVFLHIDITSAQEANTVITTPTHIIGEVPTDFETSADLEWTGGTLYQLKARLQTLGCTLNNVYIYNKEKDIWFIYSQYGLLGDFHNPEFHENYPGDYIPPTTIHIPSCYDMCGFQYTEEVLGEIGDPYFIRDIRHGNRCVSPENIAPFLPPHLNHLRSVYENNECNQNWDPRTIEQVFPIMPVMEDLCIFRANKNTLPYGISRSMNSYDHKGLWLSYYKPFITVLNNNSRESFFTELHELCHSQQDWYVSQFMSPYEPYTEDKKGLWNNTPAGKAFIDMVDFKNFPYWELDSDSPYYSVYGPTPNELAAELCAIKLYFDITREESIQHYENYYSLDTIADATPWLDEYVFVLE